MILYMYAIYSDNKFRRTQTYDMVDRSEISPGP